MEFFLFVDVLIQAVALLLLLEGFDGAVVVGTHFNVVVDVALEDD